MADRSGSALRISSFDLGVIHEFAASGLTWADVSRLRYLALALHEPASCDYAAPKGLDAQLRPYQAVGATWLAALRDAGFGGILTDDMGLGKTLQAIAHILRVRVAGEGAKTKPILIVAPTSVLPNWQAELARFAPGLECLLWHGTDRQRSGPNSTRRDWF